MTATAASVVGVSPDRGIEGAWSQRADAPGECAVVFEGRLVERDRLVGMAGLDPQPRLSDAELVLQIYRRWSLGGFARLRGAFAVVVWDERERVVYAVRDQVGQHPLFRATASGSHLVSPSIDALAADERVSRAPDRSALLGMLAPSMPFHDETPYAAVRRIPQGHVWELREGGSQTYRWWDPAPSGHSFTWATEEAVAQFGELLEQAVRRAVQSGSTGIYLSGGLDSVTVAALATDLAARRGEPPPWALSIAFPGEEANEERVQRSVAGALGLPQVMLPLQDASGIVQPALDVARTWPVPLQAPWLPAYQRLNGEATGRGVRAILTGDGGDEWLTVNPFWAADLIKQGRFRELGRFMLGYHRSFRLGFRGLADNLWRYGLRELLLDAAEAVAPRATQRRRVQTRLARLPDWLSSDPAARELLRIRLDAPRPGIGAGSAYLREGRSALDHVLMDLAAEELFEAGRRSGVSIVHPFWDPDVLALLYRVAPEKLHEGGRSKGLVRDLLESRFPGCGFGTQRKVPANDALKRVMRAEGPAARKRLGRIEALAVLGVVDGGRIERALDKMLLGEYRSCFQAWDILNLETWARTHL